jgi:hypothetical protein
MRFFYMFLVKPCVTPLWDCCGEMMYLLLGVTQFLCTLSTNTKILHDIFLLTRTLQA